MEKYRFLLSGSGGQGVITMAILLAEAAVLYEGLTAVQSQAYGPEARGGATRSDVIVSDGPIYFPKVTQPNILVALNQASFIKYQSPIRPGGILITDSHLVNVAGKLDVRHVPLPMHDAVLEELGRVQAFNICALGALAALTGVVRLTSLEQCLAKRFPSAFHENNLRALHLGEKLVRDRREIAAAS